MLQSVALGFFHLYELFLASAITTQIIVSAAVVALSSAVVYYCQNRAYANYIPLGLLFGGWRAGERVPADDQNRGAVRDGGTWAETGGGGDDGGGGGERLGREEPARATRSALASSLDRDVTRSQTSRENLPVASQGRDNKQPQPSKHGRVQESSDIVRKRAEFFGGRAKAEQNTPAGQRETLAREESIVREECPQHKAPLSGIGDSRVVQKGTPSERKVLQAHLKGKASESEEQGYSSYQYETPAEGTTASGGNGETSNKAPPRPSCISGKRERPGTATIKPKPKQQSYLDVNEKVKSLHRTTGRISVRSSATTHSHFFLPTENVDPSGKPMMQFAFGGTKVEHRLKTAKSASADSVTKPEPSHVEKLTAGSGQLRPSTETTQKETGLGTTTGSACSPGQTDIRRRSSSPAPIPWIQTFDDGTRDREETRRPQEVFKFTGASEEKQKDDDEQISLEAAGGGTAEATVTDTDAEPGTSNGACLDVPAQLDAVTATTLPKPQATDTLLPESTEAGADVKPTDGGEEGGADFGSSVAGDQHSEELIRPPVITERAPLSQLTLPSLEITEAADDEPHADEPSPPPCLNVARNKRDSLEVPMITTSELVIPKPVTTPPQPAMTLPTSEPLETQVEQTTTRAQEKFVVPKIQTFEAPPYEVPSITFDDSSDDAGCRKSDLGSMSSRESLEVPSVDIDTEAYPLRRKPPDIVIPRDTTARHGKFSPTETSPRYDLGQASPNSPTKRKSMTFSPHMSENEETDEEDDLFMEEQTKRVKRPRLQRDYGVDIPDWQITNELFPDDFGGITPAADTTDDVKSRFLNSTNESIMLFFEKTRGSNDSADSEKSDLERKIEAATERGREVSTEEETEIEKDEEKATKDDAKSRFLESPQNEEKSLLLLTTAITTSTDSGSGEAVTCGQETDDAKSRFLQPSDAAKSSLLLSKTIRSSIDGSDEMAAAQDLVVSVPSVPKVEEAQGEELNPQEEDQREEEEEEEETSEAMASAKSRFLESCVESENEVEEEIQVAVPPKNPDTGRWETGAATWGKLLESELEDDLEFYESDEELEKEPSPRDEYIEKPEDRGVAVADDDDDDDEDDLELLGAAAPKPRRRETSAYGTASDIFSPWYNKAVVIDNGSDVLKMGLAGDYIPSITMPTLVGRRRGYDLSERERHTYVGDDALASQGVLGFDFPIEGGIVGNWSDLERIWDHVFTYALALSPADHPVLMTEIATPPRHQREKYLEVLFERFHVPAVFLVNQAVLSLHASGCTSGVVLSSGSGVTEIVPIYEGFCMSHAISVLDVAGRQVTGQLASLLQHNKGYNFTTSSEWEILRIMKERLAFVALDVEEERRRSQIVEAHEYKLPDGQTMSVSDELFLCTESMFQPDVAGITDSAGVHSLVMDSLQRCDPEIRAMLKDMLLLAGGNTKLKGFVPRLQKELAALNLNMFVNAPSERDHSTWVGGSILASHSSFMDRWVTMEEYADQGASIVHRKCF